MMRHTKLLLISTKYIWYPQMIVIVIIDKKKKKVEKEI